MNAGPGGHDDGEIRQARDAAGALTAQAGDLMRRVEGPAVAATASSDQAYAFARHAWLRAQAMASGASREVLDRIGPLPHDGGADHA